jgi:hypothetical protein
LPFESERLLEQDLDRRTDELIEAIRPLTPVGIQRAGGQIIFQFPAQLPLTCPDPVQTARDVSQELGSSTVCKISPGRLTADNVLVDENQETWLTDFSGAGQAPQWWDYVCLEASIRFDLSHATDLLTWLDFEACLVTPTGFQDRLSTQEVLPALRTHVSLIEEIRKQAGGETGQDIVPYYVGLLMWTLGEIARYDPSILHDQREQMRGAHLLLAGALIARQLHEPISPVSVQGALRLDPDGKVWIGDHLQATLNDGQELRLLKLLLEHNEEIVARKQVVELVFLESTKQGLPPGTGTRINNLVNRLRQDIEPDPSHPRYVQTVRGQGYRLFAEGIPGQ